MASNKELQAQIEQLQAALANATKAKGNGELSFKVSEKGAVSVYGLGRFPVTLYSEQWPRLFAAVPRLIAFMDANRTSLSTKDKPVTSANRPAAIVPAEPVNVDIPATDMTDSDIMAALEAESVDAAIE